MTMGRYQIYVYRDNTTTYDAYNETTTTKYYYGPLFADMTDDVSLRDQDGQRIPEHRRTYTLVTDYETYAYMYNYGWRILRLGSTSGTTEYIDTIEYYSTGTQFFITIKTRMVSKA